MGRELPAEYLSRTDAARTLGVTTRTLTNMVRRGVLTPKYLDRQKAQVFLKIEVRAVLAAQEGARVNVREVKALALAALSTARRAEARLEAVYAHLGIDVVPLDRDPASVRHLYNETRQAITRNQLYSPDWLRFWSGVFFGIDDTYLELVATLTGDTQPWKTFYDFSSAVMREVYAENDSVLTSATHRFQMARTHLRQVCYLYCRRKTTPEVADVVFDGRASAVDELWALLH